MRAMRTSPLHMPHPPSICLATKRKAWCRADQPHGARTIQKGRHGRRPFFVPSPRTGDRWSLRPASPSDRPGSVRCHRTLFRPAWMPHAGDEDIAPTYAAPAIDLPRNETKGMVPGRSAPLPLLSGEVARRAGGVVSPASPQGHLSRHLNGSGDADANYGVPTAARHCTFVQPRAAGDESSGSLVLDPAAAGRLYGR